MASDSEETHYMAPVQGTTQTGSTVDTELPLWRPDMEIIFRDRDNTYYLVPDVDDGSPFRYMSRKQRALLRTFLELALEGLSDLEGENGKGHAL